MTVTKTRWPEWFETMLEKRRTMWSLEQPFYVDERIFGFEMERIFRRFWLYAGHVSQVKNPGDYFLYKLGKDSIMVIRDREGKVRAHYNTCRHRGSVICRESQGSVNKLVCPFHSWVYDMDGKLRSAMHMPEGFDKSKYGLKPVHVELMEGFIFISVADEPLDFEPARQQYKRHLAPYQLDRTKVVHTREYPLKANWKVLAENFAECYHCAANHPEYSGLIIGGAIVGNPKLQAEEDRIVAEATERWRAKGLHIEPHARPDHETWHLTCRDPFFEGNVTQSPDGQPMAPLLGQLKDPDAGVFGGIIYPTFWVESCSDNCVPIQLVPVSATQTNVRVQWLIHEDAVEGKDYDFDTLTWFFTNTGEQDWRLAVDNQAGIESSAYEPGPYAVVEKDTDFFDDWYFSVMRS